MKTLYFDCGMGAAGDMLSAALLELFDDKQVKSVRDTSTTQKKVSLDTTSALI